ncbi:MAG: NAD(+) synthase [Acholeplasmatales bacterium]|nr:NAD(+) synthase [Acholeplasmatales bacterium]
MLKEYGFLRVGAIVNKLELLNVEKNVETIKELVDKSIELGIEIVTFPELSICGYTAQDQLLNEDLYNNVIKGLKELKNYSITKDIIFIVGAPIRVENALYNCAVVFKSGKILGITPKTFVPNYSEFYESRWFCSATKLHTDKINLLGEEVTISNMLLYKCTNFPLTFSIDLCEDLWMANSPSNFTTVKGANLVFNLSASNETVGKVNYRRNLVKVQSAKTLSAYVYASSGIYESSSDILFSGHSIIAEPSGDTIENERFSLKSNIIFQDVDIFRINNDRIKTRTYEELSFNFDYKVSTFDLSIRHNTLTKKYSKKPFLSHDKNALEEILNIQTYALARRLLQLNKPKAVIGISGGSDSTLAFLVCIRAFKALDMDLKNVIAITMPGFGTSDRTYTNSKNLIVESGATFREISIKDAALLHFENIGHDKNKFDITYENTQARERTQILFDIANQEGGIVIGTGDLSELALGWATYNGDHMSNYGVNSSIPKTLVTTLIGHIRDAEEGIIKDTLTDILETPISPELLPIDENGNIQNTEKSVGPYILHDFFLYHFLRYNASLKKIYYLACLTFDEYKNEEIKACLTIFVKRFFTQQFKRNCVPDGIKVGSIAVSPRGDLRLASDVSYKMYLKELEDL